MEPVWNDSSQMQKSPPQPEDPDTCNNSVTCKEECPSPPTSHPVSPAGPSAPEAVPTTYQAASDVEPTENHTVIRSLNAEVDNHQAEESDLIYQNLSGFQTTMSGYPCITYSSTYATGNCNPINVSYSNKLAQYDVMNNVILSHGYDSPPQHVVLSGTSSPTPVSHMAMQYGSPIPYPQLSHSPVQGTSQPMWSTQGSSALLSTPYSLVADYPGGDGNDSNRSYVYGSPYLPPASFPQADGIWPATYQDKNPILPSMSYIPDSRTVYKEQQEYIRLPEPIIQHQCAICGATDSTSWKRDNANQFVCNSCSMYKPNGTRNSSSLRPQKRLSTSRRAGMTCSNCETNDTTLWRRNGHGEPVCNACGLYYKLHQVNRPISMRKDSIQTRKRKPKSNGGSSRSRGSNSTSNGRNKNAHVQQPQHQHQIQLPDVSYMTHHQDDGSIIHQVNSPSMSQRNVPSPVLPSSAALSQQQMQHLAPLDPPTSDPFLVTHGIDPHNTVINLGHK